MLFLRYNYFGYRIKKINFVAQCDVVVAIEANFKFGHL